MSAALVDYSQRAGNRPAPPGFRDIAEHPRDATAAATRTFFADISEFQPVVTSAYPYPVLAFRLDTGGRLDNHVSANWAYIHAHPDRIKVAPGYVVFIKGQTKAILSRLRNEFGSQCPPPLCPMIDMESGSGFAGPGNHSAEANDFAAELAAWAGSEKRVIGYANGYDWSTNWPTRPSWLKRTIAAYSAASTPGGFYARQFYGGMDYPTPAGYPRSCPPFGSWVDLNVIPRSVDQIIADFGLAAPHTDPLEGVLDMSALTFVRYTGRDVKVHAAVYLTNGMTQTWIRNATDLATKQGYYKARDASFDTQVHNTSRPRSGYGVVVGDDPEKAGQSVAAISDPADEASLHPEDEK